jgi:tetratricopeptide (TPR) repeat protein
MDLDRFSRLKALQPIPRAARSNAAGSDRLAALLNAERRSNNLGCHLALRHWVPDPQPRPFGPRALRLLFDGAAAASGTSPWIFLDTETTGLSGGTGTYAFLVGLAWWENCGLTIEQFFMHDHSEEPSMLAELTRRLSSFATLVTFNGKSFDWPLLETRYRMNRLHSVEAPPVHLDLLHPARRLWRLRLGSVALTELEKHILTFERGPDIPSETIPRRYFEFLRGGPAEPVAEIFRHNEMDLRSLAALSNRIGSLLEQPEESGLGGPELYGISRLMQQRGEKQLAGTLFRRALECGLPQPASDSAHRELAVLARRSGDHERANAHWRELVGQSPAGMEAYEQLAIHWEHRARDPERAALITREALVKLREAFASRRINPQRYRTWHSRLHHRLRRLERISVGGVRIAD